MRNCPVDTQFQFSIMTRTSYSSVPRSEHVLFETPAKAKDISGHLAKILDPILPDKKSKTEMQINGATAE